MDEFLGITYVMTSSENFEDYLIYLDKSYFARKAAMALHPKQCLSRNIDGTYDLSFESLLVTTTTTFKPGEEFYEVKPDGVTVKSTITIEDNKMIHIQMEENGRVSKHVREFFPEKMIVTTTAEGLDKIVKRHYVLVQ